MANRSLIHGVGINDADYPYRIHEKVNGKVKIVYQCKIHSKWKDLIRRCFSEKHKNKHPKHRDSKCCEEWKVFSVFKNWVNNQGDLYDIKLNIWTKIYFLSEINFTHQKIVY